MNVLMVAVFNDRSTNVSQAEAFERMGHTVIRFNYREIAKQIGHWRRDRRIIEICQDKKPDFVLFSKCNEVKLNVVKKCNKICPTVLWYMDPFNGNFNNSLIKKIKHCTMTFCSSTISYIEAKKYSSSGSVYFLQEGFDKKLNIPLELPKIYDVSFIGTLREDRRRYYEKIKFHVFTDAYGLKHSYVVGQTKINLNFTYKNHGTSDRTYKVLASKGFLLTTPWYKMEDDFTPGKDFDIFHSPEELKDKVDFYLKNEDFRNKIAEHGYKTVQKYTRDYWAKCIIEKVKEYCYQ